MKRTFVITLALIGALVIPRGGWGYDLAKNVVSFQLSNGMRWLFVRRTQAPVFSGVVMVRVGGADEQEGKTGLAHVFEHMAFKGSPRIGTRDWGKEKPLLQEIERVGQELTEEQRKPQPDASLVADLSKRMAELEHQADVFRAKNEIWEVMTRNGAADMNAYTSKDVTAYHASMPSTQLGLWAKVMAEMIFEPAFREFYTERNVIAEERRSGVENNPDGMMSEKILSSAFSPGGPYHWSTIGFEKDIRGLTIADARAFHRTHYVPGNMAGVLVGDLNVGEIRGILEQTFGTKRPGPVPPSPKGPGEERGGVDERFSFDAEPSFAIAYHKPTLPDPTEYAFDLIESLLCEGRSSRLQKRLVYDEKKAEAIYCTIGFPGSRLSNLFLIWIDPLKRTAPREILQGIDEEIARLAAEAVPEEEMTSVKKRVTASIVFALEQNMELAEELAQSETIYGDWRLLADYPARIRAVTTDDIQAAARKYLQVSSRVFVERVKGKRKT